MLLQMHHLVILHLLLGGSYCKDLPIETMDQDKADLADMKTASQGASDEVLLPQQADSPPHLAKPADRLPLKSSDLPIPKKKVGKCKPKAAGARKMAAFGALSSKLEAMNPSGHDSKPSSKTHDYDYTY